QRHFDAERVLDARGKLHQEQGVHAEREEVVAWCHGIDPKHLFQNRLQLAFSWCMRTRRGRRPRLSVVTLTVHVRLRALSEPPGSRGRGRARASGGGEEAATRTVRRSPACLARW